MRSLGTSASPRTPIAIAAEPGSSSTRALFFETARIVASTRAPLLGKNAT
jgi:hypothetical protein